MQRALLPISSCVVIAIIPFSVSCGSTNKAQPQGITSIDETRALNSLSATDMQSLCKDLKDYLVRESAQEYAQRICIQAAFAASSMGTPSNPSQACHDSYANCINEASATSTGIAITGLCPSNPDVTTCSLTVGTYIQCMREIIEAATAAWNLKDNLCDDLGSCTGLCQSPLTLPSTCVLVRDTCAGMAPTVDYTTTT